WVGRTRRLVTLLPRIEYTPPSARAHSRDPSNATWLAPGSEMRDVIFADAASTPTRPRSVAAQTSFPATASELPPDECPIGIDARTSSVRGSTCMSRSVFPHVTQTAARVAATAPRNRLNSTLFAIWPVAR